MPQLVQVCLTSVSDHMQALCYHSLATSKQIQNHTPIAEQIKIHVKCKLGGWRKLFCLLSILPSRTLCRRAKLCFATSLQESWGTLKNRTRYHLRDLHAAINLKLLKDWWWSNSKLCILHLNSPTAFPDLNTYTQITIYGLHLCF